MKMKVIYSGTTFHFPQLIYRTLMIASGTVLVFVVFALMYDITGSTERAEECLGSNLCKRANGKTTKILLWTPLYGKMEHWQWWFSNTEREKQCPQLNCILTTNRSLLPESDAVLFHVYDNNFNLRDLPPTRSSSQRWVFFTTEPPELTKDYSLLNNLFNWTMTYRLDSDIPLPYGQLQLKPISNLSTAIVHNHAVGKNKLVAWFVTHCNTESRRELYVKELQQYITVDIFGPCGTLTCQPPRSDACYQMLNRDYKFYIAFENIICKDYITEKFFNMLKLNVVPIIFGGPDYSRFVDKTAYIDALNFFSPKQLAEYLLTLDADDTLYNEFFHWKTGLDIQIETPENQMGCALCRKLSEDKHQQRVYTNINDWWMTDSQCKGWHNNNSLHPVKRVSEGRFY